MRKRKVLVLVLSVVAAAIAVFAIVRIRSLDERYDPTLNERYYRGLRKDVPPPFLAVEECYWGGVTGICSIDLRTGRMWAAGIALAPKGWGQLDEQLDKVELDTLWILVSESAPILRDIRPQSSWFLWPRQRYEDGTSTLVLKWADREVVLQRPPYGVAADAPERVRLAYERAAVISRYVQNMEELRARYARSLTGKQRDVSVQRVHEELARVSAVHLPRDDEPSAK